MHNLLLQSVRYRPRYSGCSKFVLYAFAFLFPLIGFIVAFMLMANRDLESKRLGLTLLILSVVATALGCWLSCVFSLLLSVLREVREFVPFKTL